MRLIARGRGALVTPGRRGLFALTGLTFIVYTVFALLGHWRFNTAGYDLGIFDQAVRNYARFRAPMVPLKGVGYNIFGDHFHPIIATAAPLYWIFNDPRTLLVLQAGLIAASVPVIYRFAHRRTSPRVSLVIATTYAFGWALQTMVNFHFHEVAYGVPILALVIDALDRADDRQLLIFSALLLLVREDMGVLLMLVGVLRAFRRPRWPAAVLIVGGAAMYEIATGIVLPHFSPTGSFAYWQYGPTLGPDLGAAVRNTITKPWHVIWLFFTPVTKLRTLSLFLIPLAFLPLRSRYAWLALPLLAQRFFEPHERHTLWEPHYHYNALPWVVMVLAFIDGAGRLGVFDRHRLTRWLSAYLLGYTAFAIVRVPDIAPLHQLVTGEMFHRTAEMKDQAAVVAAIPPDVCVQADDRIAGQLTSRDWVSIPGIDGYYADLVVIDLSQKTVGGNNGPKPAAALAAAQSAGYQITDSVGSLRVLARADRPGPRAQCRPTGSGP